MTGILTAVGRRAAIQATPLLTRRLYNMIIIKLIGYVSVRCPSKESAALYLLWAERDNQTIEWIHYC
jgi:hypothetical protein